MTFFERIFAQHAHPTKLILETLGALWAVYFLWQQNWIWALIFVIVLPILGTILVWGKNEEQLSQTTLGKFMLTHTHPLNALFHIIGAVPLAYGLWVHSALYIFLGISGVVIGHLWGWERLR